MIRIRPLGWVWALISGRNFILQISCPAKLCAVSLLKKQLLSISATPAIEQVPDSWPPLFTSSYSLQRVASLRHHPHAMKFTLLNSTTQWFFIYSELCSNPLSIIARWIVLKGIIEIWLTARYYLLVNETNTDPASTPAKYTAKNRMILVSGIPQTLITFEWYIGHPSRH